MSGNDSDHASPAGAPGPPSRSGRWWRVTVIAALLVLFVAAVGTTAAITREAATEALAERSRSDLRLYIANVRRELEKYEHLPALLAQDQRIKALLADPDRAHVDRVNRYLELAATTSKASDIYVMNPAGDTIAASNWRREDTFVGDNYGFRPYFQQALEGRLGHYFAVGYRTGERGYFFAHPVRLDSAIVGVVAVKVAITVLEQDRGADAREFMVTGPDGVIFMATHPGWRFRTLEPLSQEERARIRATHRYGQKPLEPLPVRQREAFADDTDLLTMADNRQWLHHGVEMAGAGWTVHLLADTAEVDTQVLRAGVLAAFVFGVVVQGSFSLRQRRLRMRERLAFDRERLAAAAANEARVRAVIDSTRAGLLTLDEQCAIRSCNPTAAELFGWRPDALTGRQLTVLLSARDGEGFTRQLDGAAEPAMAELTGVRRDGTAFPLEAGVNAMDLPEGRRYLVTLHDITERKDSETALRRAHDELEQRVAERTRDLLASNRRLTREIDEHRATEQALRDTRDELIQAAKLAAIGQLSAGINHELNQPLTAIGAFSQNSQALLARGRHDDVAGNLAEITRLTERMGRIIHQLKLFARKSSGSPVPVDMGGVIDAALALLAPTVQREQVTVARDLPDSGLLAFGDMLRLEQVFVNLIGNAVQAMDETRERRVEIGGSGDGTEVIISVRDTGPGIDADDLPHLFDAFYTTKKAGLGLGLSISARIVDELGGAMRADNHPLGGAVFTVVLPAASRQESAHG